MKKILAVLMCLALLLAGVSALAEDAGIWETRDYTDDDGNSTGESYILSSKVIGVYSGEATVGGELGVYVYCEKPDGEFYISFRLIEDGEILANAEEEIRYYDVEMLDDFGEVYEFEGAMAAQGRDVYFLADGESVEIIRALNRGGSLRFALTDRDNPFARYDFVIDDVSGFSGLIEAMGY